MKSFSSLSQQLQSILTTVPVYVSVNQNPDAEKKQEIIKRQEVFLKLPKGIRWKLASFETGEKIQLIGQKYGFELLRLANITRLIREYYFGEVRFENFPTEIEKRMGVSLLTAQEISRYIKSEILDWDPWAEYIAKLPKMPIRAILQQYPKIRNTEITAGYLEQKNSEEPEDPTIKNWLHDFVLHLGQERHSQMQRTQYLFHSENGKGLSSQDREKLGIILRSFDENTPLPVDEENNEIVFDGLVSEQRAANNNQQTTPAPKPQPIPTKQVSFIKPYAPISRPTLPLRQASSPPIQAQTQFIPQPRPTSPRPSPYKGEGDRPIPQSQPVANIPANFASQVGKEEINKYFSTPESPNIPSIKIHSITEHNEPKIAPQQAPPQPTIQRPAPTSPQPSPYKGEGVVRPKYKIIDPFFSKPMPKPRLDGNIVDLSDKE